jgi:excisionase family DNA binding protein
MDQQSQPKLYSVLQCAELLGISEWMVRHLLRTRQMARVRIGCRVLIPPSEVTRFVAEHTEPVTLTKKPEEQVGERPVPLVDRSDE